MRNKLITDTFPAAFLAVCDTVWGSQANSRLMGAAQSLKQISLGSERKALNYMPTTLRVTPFLTETSLKSLIYAADCCTDGSNVDFVGLDSNGKWVLVEAKPQVDSATLRGQPPVKKFGHTLAQLSAFYRAGNATPPVLSRAIITSSGGVSISGQSSWSVENGVLRRSDVVQMVSPSSVAIEVVEL